MLRIGLSPDFGLFARFSANRLTVRSLFRASVLALASVVSAQNSNIMMTIPILILFYFAEVTLNLALGALLIFLCAISKI